MGIYCWKSSGCSGWLHQSDPAGLAGAGLYDKTHCLDTRGEPADYTGKVLVIRPNWLKDSYKKPEYQLFLADSGFGCSPKASGRKVFGQFLYDGEQTHLDRDDFIGTARWRVLTQSNDPAIRAVKNMVIALLQ